MPFFYIILLIAVFTLTIILKLKMPSIKGYAGESKVSSILHRLPSDKYIVMNDVMLNTSYGTSQIDYVVFSVYGIFVIETKNYSGWIYGGDNSENWTKNVYGNKYPFRNPLKQNYAHIKALQEVLGIDNQKAFISIIAFSNAAELKFQSSQNVINFRQLKNCIQNYTTEILTFGECNTFSLKLYGTTDYTKEQKKTHVQDIKTATKERENKIQNGICPKCGGQLVLRKGKFGSFYGCSNYPRCHFTQNL